MWCCVCLSGAAAAAAFACCTMRSCALASASARTARRVLSAVAASLTCVDAPDKPCAALRSPCEAALKSAFGLTDDGSTSWPDRAAMAAMAASHSLAPGSDSVASSSSVSNASLTPRVLAPMNMAICLAAVASLGGVRTAAFAPSSAATVELLKALAALINSVAVAGSQKAAMSRLACAIAVACAPASCAALLSVAGLAAACGSALFTVAKRSAALFSWPSEADLVLPTGLNRLPPCASNWAESSNASSVDSSSMAASMAADPDTAAASREADSSFFTASAARFAASSRSFLPAGSRTFGPDVLAACTDSTIRGTVSRAFSARAA
mmetsp:Transcript_2425/g.7729  ORF Transcript_2425/g.7729 Transcript_2425/m.7729 type:complete len:325 (+) Transcript_2425:2959-3933(+)